MEDLDLDAAFLADPHRLRDRADQAGALVAHVGGVEAVAAAGDAGQRDQVLGGLEAVGRIDERARNAERAGVHRGRDLGLHRRQLRRCRPAGAVAHDVDPRLRRRIISAEIDRDALLLEPPEIGVDLARRHRRAALAGDDGGDAHPSLFSAAPCWSRISPDWSIMSMKPGAT